MEIVRQPKIEWLAMKWIFLAFSFVLVLLSTLWMVLNGPNLGVDFTGGTLVYVKFKEVPQFDRIRKSLTDGGIKAEELTRFDAPSKYQIQIRIGYIEDEDEQDLGLEANRIFDILSREYDQAQIKAGRLDLNNISKSQLSRRLQELEPKNLGEEQSITGLEESYSEAGTRVVDYRDGQGGIVASFSELSGLTLSPVIIKTLEKNFYLGSFTIISVENVGPKVGQELQERARDAIIFSLIGMLIYIAIRFRPIYGLAAILALFHDVFITVGIFSMAGKEITLTVIAALLTLVGYSLNDTIVVFDRVRENSKLMRQSDLTTLINTSINQTLNRTILTSTMTFLAVFSLYVLGGQVLNGFSFILVIGIAIGTYSSIAVASPIVFWWQTYLERRKAKV